MQKLTILSALLSVAGFAGMPGGDEDLNRDGMPVSGADLHLDCY